MFPATPPRSVAAPPPVVSVSVPTPSSYTSAQDTGKEILSAIQKLEHTQSEAIKQLEHTQSKAIKQLEHTQSKANQAIKSRVETLSFAVSALVGAGLSFDSVANVSDPSINRESFKKNILKAYGLKENARHEEFVASKIGLPADADVPPSVYVSFDFTIGRILPSAMVIAAHIFQH